MANLRRADYTQHLAGKVIQRVEWTNDQTEHYYCLCLFFDDQTMASFRIYQSLQEDFELQDFIDGNISNERLLTPHRIQRPKKDGE